MESRTATISRVSDTTQAAWLISIIGHPFVLAALLVLVASWKRAGEAEALRTTGVVVGGLALLGLFMWRRYRTRQWQNMDASAVAERWSLFAASFVVLLLLLLYFRFVRRSADAGRGVEVIILMLVGATAINRWLKISLHMAFAAFVAVVLLKIAPACGIAAVAFAPVLAWSRVKMRRHTTTEVLAGLLLGAAAAALELWG